MNVDSGGLEYLVSGGTAVGTTIARQIDGLEHPPDVRAPKTRRGIAGAVREENDVFCHLCRCW
jgi:hypothetical protein